MTIYLFELAWILPSVAIPAAMLVALIVTAFGAGIHVPGVDGRVDPTKLTETAPFDEPGVVGVLGFPVSNGNDQPQRQLANRVQADDDGGPGFPDFGPDRGVEVDQPDFTAFGRLHWRHTGHPCRRR